MAKTVTLIRHAETNANASGVWLGNTDSGFSERGNQQLESLSARVARQPDVLVASDLSRTVLTANVLGEATHEAGFREFGIGGWEGLTTQEIGVQFPGELEAFFRGENLAPGGGELMSDFRQRVGVALDGVVESLPDGGHGVVVTHGGVIWAIVSGALRLAGTPVRMIPSHNTALTTLRFDEDGSVQVSTFNDASHLPSTPTGFGPTGPTVALYRHGETEGNVAHRWQGHSNSPLTPLGHDQVKAAAEVAPYISRLYTSPLGRAVETATILADALGVDFEEDGELIEMSFGGWEDLTESEAAASDPQWWKRVFQDGEDLQRGRTGETFGHGGERIGNAIERLVSISEDPNIGIVSHGAVIRGCFIRLLGLSFSDRDVIPVPRNSSLSQIKFTESGPVVAAYNVAPHMDV